MRLTPLPVAAVAAGPLETQPPPHSQLLAAAALVAVAAPAVAAPPVAAAPLPLPPLDATRRLAAVGLPRLPPLLLQIASAFQIHRFADADTWAILL